MIIHASTVDLQTTDIRLLADSGLRIDTNVTHGPVPVGLTDFASRLRQARALTQDPARRAVIVSFLKQLRA